MKYAPGRYSVTTFDAVGSKLRTISTHDNGGEIMSLSVAENVARREMEEDDETASYVIQRVIQNSMVTE